jgi:hypothetical protein
MNNLRDNANLHNADSILCYVPEEPRESDIARDWLHTFEDALRIAPFVSRKGLFRECNSIMMTLIYRHYMYFCVLWRTHNRDGVIDEKG